MSCHKPGLLLSGLPADAIILILRELDDIRDLRSAVMSCKAVYKAFSPHRRLICSTVRKKSSIRQLYNKAIRAFMIACEIERNSLRLLSPGLNLAARAHIYDSETIHEYDRQSRTYTYFARNFERTFIPNENVLLPDYKVTMLAADDEKAIGNFVKKLDAEKSDEDVLSQLSVTEVKTVVLRMFAITKIVVIHRYLYGIEPRFNQRPSLDTIVNTAFAPLKGTVEMDEIKRAYSYFQKAIKTVFAKKENERSALGSSLSGGSHVLEDEVLGNFVLATAMPSRLDILLYDTKTQRSLETPAGWVVSNQSEISDYIYLFGLQETFEKVRDFFESE